MPETDVPALCVHLCADEVVYITIDSRTGRLNLRNTGDLAAAGRGPRFQLITKTVNDNPTILLEALVRLRLTVRLISSQHIKSNLSMQTITDLAEQKAKYLGLQSFRHRNILKEGS